MPPFTSVIKALCKVLLIWLYVSAWAAITVQVMVSSLLGGAVILALFLMLTIGFIVKFRHNHPIKQQKPLFSFSMTHEDRRFKFHVLGMSGVGNDFKASGNGLVWLSTPTTANPQFIHWLFNYSAGKYSVLVDTAAEPLVIYGEFPRTWLPNDGCFSPRRDSVGLTWRELDKMVRRRIELGYIRADALVTLPDGKPVDRLEFNRPQYLVLHSPE